MANTRISLVDFVKELEQLCQQRQTGRLVVTTIHHQFISLGLLSGRIIWINYANKTGSAALSEMATLTSIADFTFIAFTGSLSHLGAVQDLPPNERIFWHLIVPDSSSSTATVSSDIPLEYKPVLEKTLARTYWSYG